MFNNIYELQFKDIIVLHHMSSSGNSTSGAGYAILTDPDQEIHGFYKVLKVSDIQSSLRALNMARASRDWKLIKFWPCTDLKKLESIIKTGEVLKKRLYNGSQEWVKVDKDGLAKLMKTLEALVIVANETDDD